MPSYNVTLERDGLDDSIEVLVDLKCTYGGAPASGPTFSSGGEPAEPPEFDYEAHTVLSPAGIVLTPAEFDKAVDKAIEDAVETYAPEDYEPDYEPDYD